MCSAYTKTLRHGYDTADLPYTLWGRMPCRPGFHHIRIQACWLNSGMKRSAGAPQCVCHTQAIPPQTDGQALSQDTVVTGKLISASPL
ncbi:uncharacterized protein [Misgurnus anguillicaudatus]|uniref:uncharacterized protein n=1 Tax=Misgurnus anguillicaudatus TaxID=75329 RepID=UPI003CCFA3FB